MWRNIATMIYGWCEQMQPGGAGGEYLLTLISYKLMQKYKCKKQKEI